MGERKAWPPASLAIHVCVLLVETGAQEERVLQRGCGNVLLGVQGGRGLTTTRRETEGTSGWTAGRQTWRAQGIHRSPGGKSGVRRGRNLGRARGEECGLEPEEWQHRKGVRKEPTEKHREARQEPLESRQKSR